MKRFTLYALFWTVVLAGCGSPLAPATPETDELATRVSGTLTALPPAITLPPEIEPSATAPAFTESPEPTELPPTATLQLTPTPSPTATPVASFTPLATPTLPSGDFRTQLGSPLWSDTFTSGAGWPLGEDDFTRAEVEDGSLALTGLSTSDGWRLTGREIEDFYLEMTVDTGSCSANDHYGLIFRVPELKAADRGYLAGFTCGGRYSLRAWDGESMTSLIAATASSSIQAGSDRTNRMGVLADGDRLVLYANGIQLAELEDDTFTDSGFFGIFVGARQTEEFTIYVSEIAYWASP